MQLTLPRWLYTFFNTVHASTPRMLSTEGFTALTAAGSALLVDTKNKGFWPKALSAAMGVLGAVAGYGISFVGWRAYDRWQLSKEVPYKPFSYGDFDNGDISGACARAQGRSTTSHSGESV